MHSTTIITVLSTVVLIKANPVEKRQATTAWQPLLPCFTCLTAAWTPGPQCTTDATLISVLSRVATPPSDVTDYTATSFCSEYLQQTLTTFTTTSTTGISTGVVGTVVQEFVTVTDTTHPTSTGLCAIPSQGMTCGISNPGIIQPTVQEEDWSVSGFEDPIACHAACLSRAGCKSFRSTGSEAAGYSCMIFDMPLGVNGSNVESASAGNQFYDRNCQVYLPTECVLDTPLSPPTPTAAIAARIPSPEALSPNLHAPRTYALAVPTAAPAPAPATTAAPIIPRIPFEEFAIVEKRSSDLPYYLNDLANFYSSVYVIAACTCLITSALAETSKTSVQILRDNTKTVTSTSTFIDVATVTVTPYSTTVYQSIS